MLETTVDKGTSHRLPIASPDFTGIFQPLEKNKIRFQPVPIDVLVQCPKCKTVETLQFIRGKLLPCPKFSQVDGKVYHACNSNLPCKLYRLGI